MPSLGGSATEGDSGSGRPLLCDVPVPLAPGPLLVCGRGTWKVGAAPRCPQRVPGDGDRHGDPVPAKVPGRWPPQASDQSRASPHRQRLHECVRTWSTLIQPLVLAVFRAASEPSFSLSHFFQRPSPRSESRQEKVPSAPSAGGRAAAAQEQAQEELRLQRGARGRAPGDAAEALPLSVDLGT